MCDVVSFSQQLQLPLAMHICWQVNSALQHLHRCGILHRDLRADNVLVFSTFPLVVKVSDFGLGHVLQGTTNWEAVGDPSTTRHRTRDTCVSDEQ